MAAAEDSPGGDGDAAVEPTVAATDGEPDLRSKWAERARLRRLQASIDRDSNLQQNLSIRSAVRDARRWRWFLFAGIAAVVLFVAKTVYMSVARFPRLGEWWAAAKSEPARYALKPTVRRALTLRDDQGAIRRHYRSPVVVGGSGVVADAGIGIHQICTTHDNPPLAWLLELLAVWRHLDVKGAQFVRAAIHHLEYDAEESAGRLNLLHLQGSIADYMHASYKRADALFTPTGPTDAVGADALWRSWEESARYGNIWHDIYPKTKAALLRVPLFRDAAEGRGSAVSDLRNLLDGGLLAVARAETRTDEKATDVLDYYFGSVAAAVRPDCGAQRVDGALNGMLMMGSIAPGFVTGALTLTTGALMGAVTLASGVAGYIVGGSAAEEACVNSVR